MRSQYKLLLMLLIFSLPYMPSALAVEKYNTPPQALVDKIRDISEKTWKEWATERWLLRSLDDLIAQYEWPWCNELPGDNPCPQLFHRFRGRSMLIKTVKLADLNDGQPHELEWRMTDYGDIELLLDQQSLLRSRDRGFSKGFNQFSIINKGGDFGVHNIQLQGGSQ